MLQWGHAYSAWNTVPGKQGAGKPIKKLQWGHAYSAWNTVRSAWSSVRSTGFNGATLIQRGILFDVNAAVKFHGSFNGATLIQRGIRTPQATGLGDPRASMGPRLFSVEYERPAE